MGLRKLAAQAVSAGSTAVLKHVFHRPAANFPGKVALYVDPAIIGDMAYKIQKGSVIVVGTNGKTTVTNMLADALEAAGQRVICNRTGANLDSGVATSLLHADVSDWGIFESDELWMAKILPFLKSDYVVLLNLFRDQLDRVGEIDKVQDSIVNALASSPSTVLIYNADDPLCTAIADKAPNKTIPFGITEDMHLPQNTVADAQMCQMCSGMLNYEFRQYGQLGDFHCTECDFGRHAPAYGACDIAFTGDGLRFNVVNGCATGQVTAPYQGAYMVYNLLAVYTAAMQVGCPADKLQDAIDAFAPDNGRLQHMTVRGRKVLLNLAKNPTGFNQNMKLVVQGEGRKAAAFFINDKEADGRDISWIWDVDFEELAQSDDLVVFAGGIRGNDLQMRLKHAGITATLVQTADDVMNAVATLPEDYQVYVIANYTALPAVHSALERMRDESAEESQAAVEAARGGAVPPLSKPQTPDELQKQAADQAECFCQLPEDARESLQERPLRIVHMFPDLLNLYGDGGNIKVLRNRCAWRGMPVEVQAVTHGMSVNLAEADIVFLGGGPDREQRLASEQLLAMGDDLRAYAADNGVILAICGGFQILGRKWLLADEVMEGLAIADIETRRSDGDRIIDNVVLNSHLTSRPVVGYENHAGRTFLDASAMPLGKVVNSAGKGNNDDDGIDGVVVNNVIGTYLHGPALGKNPELADVLIAKALERRVGHEVALPALDDAVEIAANEYMVKRLK